MIPSSLNFKLKCPRIKNWTFLHRLFIFIYKLIGKIIISSWKCNENKRYESFYYFEFFNFLVCQRFREESQIPRIFISVCVTLVYGDKYDFSFILGWIIQLVTTLSSNWDTFWIQEICNYLEKVYKHLRTVPKKFQKDISFRTGDIPKFV